MFCVKDKTLSTEDEIFLEYIKASHGLSAPKKDDSPQKGCEKKSRKKAMKKTLLEYKIDLHGLTFEEAKSELNTFILQLMKNQDKPFKLKVITGKGKHSTCEGTRLYRDIPSFLKKKWQKNILDIDESPADIMIDGVPIRGFFSLVLRK